MKFTKGGNGLQIRIPIPQRVLDRNREAAFNQLMRQIVLRAQQEKAKLNGEEGQLVLTDAEMKELAEKTREQLERIGWWREGAGIR